MIRKVTNIINADKAPLLDHQRSVGEIPKTFYQTNRIYKLQAKNDWIVCG
ncbi:hypothetical protein ACIQ4I_15125 [Rummeliibacillus sp. NPDC094406]